MPTLRSGQLLSARYQIHALLATGGMAEIWTAHDLFRGEKVAVKVLRPDVHSDTSAADRLRAESKAAAMLTSPRSVRVYDSGESVDADGRSAPYLVMELVEGQSLREVLNQRYALSAGEVTRVVSQVAEALAEAHAVGIVHRDVKPANILVLPSGDTKITDFGISSLEGSGVQTATGLVMGTARYLSPEQVSGRRATAASDIYSLGVVAHEALRGAPMYDGDSEIATALAHVQGTPPPLGPRVPEHLRALVSRMLSKDPALRPTAPQVVAALESRPERTLALVLPAVSVQRRGRRGLLVAGGVAASLLAIGAAANGQGPSMPQRPTISSVAPTASATPAPSVNPAALTTTVVPTKAPVAKPVTKPVAHVVRHAVKPIAHVAPSHAKKQAKPRKHENDD